MTVSGLLSVKRNFRAVNGIIYACLKFYIILKIFYKPVMKVSLEKDNASAKTERKKSDIRKLLSLLF